MLAAAEFFDRHFTGRAELRNIRVFWAAANGTIVGSTLHATGESWFWAPLVPMVLLPMSLEWSLTRD
ncbi:MAG: hypothetical protein Q7U75_12635 [Desulfobacterales bacterium]|nr:hypothetical protein [Desulfobacterales bacterium]